VRGCFRLFPDFAALHPGYGRSRRVLGIAHSDLSPIGASAGVIDVSDLLLIRELVFGAPW
jgi:hypothetical protein